MKTLVLLSVYMVLFASQDVKPSQDLAYINQKNQLKLFSVDDKCGEFGGVEQTIIIYREGFEGILCADFEEKTTNCDRPIDGTKLTANIKKVKLSNADVRLVIASINELAANKLNRSSLIISHSGLFHQAKLDDASLTIEDFPAKEWKNFKALVLVLKKK